MTGPQQRQGAVPFPPPRPSSRERGEGESFGKASLLCLVLLALLATGCDTDVPAEPGLADSLMVDVLIGVHLADARASRTGEPRDSLRTVALTALGTDTAAFHRALDYYAHHPEAYQPLYDRALDRLLDERRSAVE